MGNSLYKSSQCFRNKAADSPQLPHYYGSREPLEGTKSGVISSETIAFRPATALSREGHCHLQLRRAEILRKGFRQAASNVVAPEVEGFVRPNLRQLWNCRGDDSRQVRDCSFSLVSCNSGS